MELIKLLAPIKAVYMTALVKFVIANRKMNEKEIGKLAQPINSLYKTVTSIMIYCHILSLITIVTLFALFRIMDFITLKNMILLLEFFFGAYIGLIMTDMFKTEEKEEKTA
jgi:predicted CDP-diglyceride synthetase/phosphatidate cytidylyltransferase